MKNTLSRISVIALMVITTIFAAGCGGATDETMQYGATAQAPGTLTFKIKDPGKGLLSGTFENAGYSLHFDVVRGEENPLVERMGFGAPSHAIDARLCDEKHFCFAQQAGGHAFADPSWVEDNSEANSPDNDRALKNIKIRKEFRQKLSEIGSKEFTGLQEEYQALLDASTDPPGYLNEASPESLLSKTPQKGVLALTTATSAASGSYTHQHWMKKQGIFFGSILGDHSASYINTLNSSGTVVGRYWTCNHGACGNSSSMNTYCIRNYANRPASLPINTQCIANALPGTMHPSGYNGCCSTQYNFVGVSHVCNDDTRLQRDFMIAGAPMSTPYCGDTVLAQYAPSCI
jgi:hypothetical protein